MRPVLASLMLAALAIASDAFANTLITFEELPGGLTAMVNSPGSAVPAGSQLTTQYLASDGVRFSSGGGFAALVNHGAGNPTGSVPNVIGGSAAAGALNYNETITISFFDPANVLQMATTDFFRIEGDWVPLGSGSAFAEAYDANGTLLATTSDTDNKVLGVSGPVLTFSLPGIHSVRIRGDNGTISFDNLEFGTLVAVPEASAAAMLALAGLVWGRCARTGTRSAADSAGAAGGTRRR